MPQLILNSNDKDLMPTFIMNFEKTYVPLLSWENIFDAIEKKYKISRNIIFIVNDKGKRKRYKEIIQTKLNLWDYVMYNSITNEIRNDFYISYGIHISSLRKH
jgi:hypothetical protein